MYVPWKVSVYVRTVGRWNHYCYTMAGTVTGPGGPRGTVHSQQSLFHKWIRSQALIGPLSSEGLPHNTAPNRRFCGAILLSISIHPTCLVSFVPLYTKCHCDAISFSYNTTKFLLSRTSFLISDLLHQHTSNTVSPSFQHDIT